MSQLRKTRIVVQTVFFVLFAGSFFVLNTHPRAYTAPGEWFLQLNPLVGIVVSLSSRTLVWGLLGGAAVMIVVTVLMGRVFCGMICPLGALIDFSDKHFLGRMRGKNANPPRQLQRVKYVFLTAIAAAAVFGVTMPLFMDPISLLTRIFTLVIHPLVKIAGADGLALVGPVLRSTPFREFGYTTVDVPLYYGTPGAALLLFVVLGGGLWDKRFWCQYVCPSGAFFGLLSRRPLFRRVVSTDDTCNNCRACSRVCPTGAIEQDEIRHTRSSECIVCGLCTGTGRAPACSRFAFGSPRPSVRPVLDVKRRDVVVGVAGGALMLPAFRATAISRRDNTGRLIRPPGAVEEPEFLSRCITCGECMKVCPTNAIQPCGFTDGFSRLNTAKIVPRIGGCEEKCHLCGHVCPTGAIRPLTCEQKKFVKIGTAVVDRHRCLAWAQNKECLVCDEVCPYNAIEPRIVETTKGPFKVPVVYEDLCMGCGLCEQHCPIYDRAAIVVYKFGENRRSRGKYLSRWEKEAVEQRRIASDSDRLGHGGEDVGDAEAGPVSAETGAMDYSGEPGTSADTGSTLPPGFLP